MDRAWELGAIVPILIERSASTLTTLDVRCAPFNRRPGGRFRAVERGLGRRKTNCGAAPLAAETAAVHLKFMNFLMHSFKFVC